MTTAPSDRTEEPAPRPGTWLAPAPRFVAGRAVSDVGDWLTTVAVAVALWDLTHSVSAPALAILLRVAPRPVGTVAGGRVADRFGAVRSLVALNLGRGAVTALLAVALATGSVPAALLLLVASQAAGAAAQPAGQAAVPRLVAAGDVARVNALVGAVDAVALVVGPGVAAALLAVAAPLGVAAPAWLVGADALSFLVLAGLLASLRPVRPATPTDGGAVSTGWAGVGAVLHRPFTRQLALAQLGLFATITALQAVLPAAAAQRFGSAAGVGWVYMAIGVGNAGGAVWVLRRHSRGLRPRSLAALTLLELLPLAAFAVIGAAWADICLAVLSGAASAPYEILAASELARTIPAGRLGRTSGAVWLFGYAGMLAGGLVAVVMASRVGWSATVLLVALGGLAVLASGWVRPRRLLAVVPR